MSETQPWKFFALQGLNFQSLKLKFQFLEGKFKMSEPWVYGTVVELVDMSVEEMQSILVRLIGHE
jgi:hypothetical protein